ncbi:MAG: nuclear transport factor 2 family protein [Phenylobacterium sp.]|uniref:nuclear transport factor 2 family protein n=1 Tax=Phenylobacterium sp. TaxID=1871053 RepID=UPI0025F64BCD|nr:nuclear transport factor 2 family protein [Phenylobacterium sp.]MBI1197499.1 nuclear transport factor 2 family protein [Phenylobacterium sp.]
MPSRAAVEAFVAQVLSGDHVGAIADWYAEDATMQENQDPPRVGREALMEGERQALARAAKVETELLAPPIVDGDRAAIHWRFTFTSPKGVVRSFEEIAWQTWRGDKVWRETFFYDPAQTR